MRKMSRKGPSGKETSVSVARIDQIAKQNSDVDELVENMVRAECERDEADADTRTDEFNKTAQLFAISGLVDGELD